IFLQAEYEHSTYAFATSNTDMLVDLFSFYEKEAEATMKKGLVFPAYDYVLNCSHTFNLLDAEGDISVLERTGAFARVRHLARHIAESYVKEREKLGYPLLKHKEVQ